MGVKQRTEWSTVKCEVLKHKWERYLVRILFAAVMAIPVMEIWNWQVDVDFIVRATETYDDYYDSYQNQYYPEATAETDTTTKSDPEIEEEPEPTEEEVKAVLKLTYYRSFCISLLLIWLISVLKQIPLPFAKK